MEKSCALLKVRRICESAAINIKALDSVAAIFHSFVFVRPCYFHNLGAV